MAGERLAGYEPPGKKKTEVRWEEGGQLTNRWL